MTGIEGRLYDLLPRFYRQRDADRGRPLEALFSVLEDERRRVEVDIAALYDNWFVETCDGWAVTYLAEILGIEPPNGGRWSFLDRRRVANTLANRRRKGTAAALESAIEDATGWVCRVVETGRLLARTHHLGGEPGARCKGVSVREAVLTSPGGAFDELPRGYEVPSRSGVRPRDFHPAGLRVHLWRMRARRVARSMAAPAGRPSSTGFTFDPLGRDVRLFRNGPRTSADERNDLESIPRPLSHADLGPDRGAPALRVFVRDGSDSWSEVPPERMRPADLSTWPGPETLGPVSGEREVAVDVERGRLAFLSAAPPALHGEVVVDYSEGFVGDLGAGSQEGIVSIFGDGEGDVFERFVAWSREGRELVEAVRAWNRHAVDRLRRGEAPRGRIVLTDDGYHDVEDELRLVVPPTSRLALVARPGVRPVVHVPRGLRVSWPYRDLRTTSGAGRGGDDVQARPRLLLEGILVSGTLVLDGRTRVEAEGSTVRGALDLFAQSCTFLSEDGPALVQLGPRAELDVRRSVLGGCVLARVKLRLQDSVLDGAGGLALAGDPEDGSASLDAELARVTALGPVSAPFRRLQATDVLFAGALRVTEPSDGRGAPEVRLSHCYVAPGSSLGEAELEQSLLASGEERPIWPRPVFDSVRVQDADYARLAPACPREIRRLGTDGSEPGAHHDLFEAHARLALEKTLEEFLPFGLMPDVRFVT